ncbi:lytic polysaccharide monooxygenase, partial [Saccharata proteae CBS 121410]
TLLAAAAIVPSTMAHYCFNRLIVDGNVTDTYEYVRVNNNSNSPITQYNSTDMRCNAGGLLTGNVTDTYKLAAGSEVGFALDTAIGHPGPLQVYMSKAPGEASEYDGSGDWFKVYEMGVSSITDEGLQWASSEITNFTFTLPDEVPAGQYFLRVEHIALHGASTFEGAQFYISCAQIEVTGSSTETPAPVVDIPGVYTGYEPGLMINIYWPIPTNYTMPGPAVW